MTLLEIGVDRKDVSAALDALSGLAIEGKERLFQNGDRAVIRLTVKEENRAEAIQILRASIRSFSLRGIFKENGGREPIEETEEWDEASARRLFGFARID